jgi:hypothetical protein
MALVVPFALLHGSLPSPIAVHFEADGTADGSMSSVAFLAMMAALILGSAVVLVVAAWRPGSLLGIQASVATFVGWTASWVAVLVILANDDQARWQDATLGNGAVWGATASAFGAAIPVARMVGRHERPARPDVSGRMALGEDERAAWFGNARSMPLGMTALASAYVGTVVLLTLGSGSFGSGFTVLVVGLAIAAFVRVDVRVTRAGVAVRSGLFGWPRVHLPLDEIESAAFTEVQPLRFGGWGYRGSLRLFRRANWVVRKGPGLVVRMTRGREFVVTVDDADEAAAVLNGLLARRAAATPRPG